MSENIEWVVFRDGQLWTDRLNNESDCLFHMQLCMETEEIFTEDDYEYRKMTKEEMDEYE